MNFETKIVQMLSERGETVVWSTDASLRIQSIRGASLIRRGGPELLGHVVAELAGSRLDCAVTSHRQALAGESCHTEIELAGRIWEVRIDPLRADDGSITGCAGMAHDITDLRRIERKLVWQSEHDPVTGLPNRRQMHEHLAEAVARARRDGDNLAVLVVDVDAFRSVNAAVGQASGDGLLGAAARRIAACAGSRLAARTGDNEFTIVACSTVPDDVHELAALILSAFELPFFIDGHEVHVTASVGVADLAREGDGPDALLRAGAAALRRAKDLGGNQRQHSSSDVSLAEYDRIKIERCLRRAIRENELSLVYQPQVRLQDGAILGLEALLRWNRDGVIVPASAFIHDVERTSAIVTLGQWVMEEACRQIEIWTQAGIDIPRIAVNVGARHFQQPELVATIRESLFRHGVMGDQLELEITETTAMHDADVTIRIVDALRELGLQITIDDFGTGYSSLAYLKRFAITGLKIDQSFVADVPSSRSATAIVNAILATAHALDLRVVAEGVETSEQAGFLTDAGCDQAQGYWFARPMTADLVPAYLLSKGDLSCHEKRFCS